jgi:hypothetical protein
VYPSISWSPSIAPHLSQADSAALQLPPPAGCEVGAQFWEQRNDSRRKWSIDNFPYRPPHPPLLPRCDLQSILTWSLSSAAHLTTPIIHQLRWLSAHAEWRAQHVPATHPPNDPLPARSTTAPLTQCKPSAGLAPFLTFRSPENHYQQAARARLLLGRSRTGQVQQRFAKAAVAAAVNPHCSFCPTSPLPTIESIDHVLLHCPQYQTPRANLASNLSQLDSSLLPLSLSTILVASPPPPPFRSSNLTQLIRLTSTFLSTIAAVRIAAGLVPLDTG